MSASPVKSDLTDYVKKQNYSGSVINDYFNFREDCDIYTFYGLLIIEQGNDFCFIFVNYNNGNWLISNDISGNLLPTATNNQGTIAFSKSIAGYNYRLISLN